MRILIGALAVAVLAGCSSNAITIKQTTPASPDEVYAYQAKPSGPSGRVTVMREGGAYGAACDVVVYVNDKRAAKLGTSERATFHLPVGKATVGVGLTDSGLCGGAEVRTIPADVPLNGEKLYRISSDINGWLITPYVEHSSE